MRLLLIITLVCFSTFILLPNISQSFSQSDNCPQGTKTEVRGMEIICIPISDIKRTCPVGTYQGLDNQQNFACRDIDTNQIVDPNTGIMTNSQTGELILQNDQKMYVVVGIIILIILVAIIAKTTKSKSVQSSRTQNHQNGERQNFTELTKRQVMENQGGRCNICSEIPKHWEFDHIHGRANNSIENCQGLCRDCHQKKTLDDT